jgi:hypothetical protein
LRAGKTDQTVKAKLNFGKQMLKVIEQYFTCYSGENLPYQKEVTQQ